MKISTKLALSYCILIICILTVGISAYSVASNSLIGNYKSSTEQSLDTLGDYFEYAFGDISSETVSYVVDPEMVQFVSGKMDEGTKLTYFNSQKDALVSKVASNSFISNMHFLSDSSQAITTAKKSIDNGYSSFVATEQGEIFAADATKCWIGQMPMLDTLLQLDSDTYAVRVVKRFYKVNAVLIVDIDKQAVLDGMNRIQLGEESNLVFITQDGQDLYQDGSRNNTFSKLDFYKDALESEEALGTVENVEYNGNKNLFIYRKIGDTGCMVCALVPNSVITSQVANIGYVVIGGAVISTVIALIVAIGISTGINKSIKHFITKMRQISKGDMGARMELTGKSEFALISEQMNEMLDSVCKLLSDVKTMSLKVSDSAADINNSSTVIEESALYISTAMADVQSGLSSQAADTESCNQQMDGLADCIGEVVNNTENIKDIAGNTELYITSSRDAIDGLKEKAAETSKITYDIIETIEELRIQTKKIDKILHTVYGIADETSMLALNASIEASRAGEAGRGFAVVAGEIGKLADQSMQATNEIGKIIAGIGDTTALAVEKAGTAGETISRQEEAVNTTLMAFGNMVEQLNQLVAKVGTISQRATDMSVQKDEAIRNVQGISDVTQSAVEAVIEVNEKTVKQEEEVVKLAKLSAEMEVQIKELEKTLQRFKLN